ncbi:hypothetical protein AGDE_03902 [Angomonas deanei]|uniref:Autophagy-related protein n=1 Tax=Angomonas deanei TaxID=59799 RepID=S9UTV2_9TRYP|nr:hypothetical protein AGDE_08792 [Angomonas deanei]EPY40026.1 hypothetical protein AGDE_03902 [Angomonas deanei]CAD2217646.1 Autophagy protein Atg8 ubiquitin like/Ubiquitin-like autophagy protein Apg12, putative [Angomonas deanei]|eukprot:EPY32239.1 hypothetical protein AGDE_08792 [Angomonas deanei]
MVGYKSFKELHTLEQRKKTFEKFFEKSPDAIAVVVEYPEAEEAKKFCVPPRMVMSSLVSHIQQRLSLDPTEAIFAYVGDTVAPPVALLQDLYKEYKDEDGFLYVKIKKEVAYGSL